VRLVDAGGVCYELTTVAASKSPSVQTKIVTVDFSNTSDGTYAPLAEACAGLDVGVLGTPAYRFFTRCSVPGK
jgi:hypothetical protein